ncbi:tetratricopeptide repeat protein [Micromonospora sp. NPDC049101]|uniref:tetratricopeptide repeat protein n=1 Tax=Micromonospora sp. NPDC049101 TaxID=3155032 RepID=UPI0034066010
MGQHVSAVEGFAHGVVGADLHVGADGVPLYLLARWERVDTPPKEWLAELPSRLLDARHRVVPFTGRDDELAAYRRWRDGPAAYGIRWLHGPGGQGKTRLADEVAAQAHDDGWLVVTASAGAGQIHAPSAGPDLRAADTPGVMVIVDYADRWPVSHLMLLLENRLLARATVPVRVLFLGRSDATWRGLTSALNAGHLELASERLSPLTGAGDTRRHMFEVAHRAFQDGDEGVPAGVGELLARPDFGLTLAVHMAALVAVDARPLPADLAGLTLSLLDREQLHWANRYGRGGRLRPDLMRRVVFVASVCGVRPSAEAAGLLSDALPGHIDPVMAADDHAACYPADDTQRLQPLYPDRLAEDFVALTLDGHDAPHPSAAWAGPLLARLLERDPAGSSRPWLSAAMSTLAAASLRWPHVGARHLYPVLRSDPRLAVEAGGSPLAALATAEGVDLDLLVEIEPHLPKGRHLDLDLAALTLQRRLADQRLAAADGPRARGDVHVDLGYRLNVAGHREQARTEMAAAVEAYRIAAAGIPADPDLAHAVMNLAHTQLDVGDRSSALASAEEARDLYRTLAVQDPPEHEPDLAYAWMTLGTVLAALGRHREGADACGEAVQLYARLAESDLDQYEGELAGALGNRGIWLHGLGAYDEALADVRRASAIYRRRAATDPNAYLHEVAASLVNEGMQLDGLRRYPEAVEVMTESVAAYRKLAKLRPDSFEHFLATALSNLSEPLLHVRGIAEALAASAEAVEIRRRLATARPAVFEADLAVGLNNYAVDLLAAERTGEAMDAVAEAVAIRRRLAAGDRATYTEFLASSLNNQGQVQRALGQPEGAAESYAEATALYRELTAERPAAHRINLVTVLNGSARALHDLGRHDESQASAEESVRVYSELPAEVRERPGVRQLLEEAEEVLHG